jgi:hypothetical protein
MGKALLAFIICTTAACGYVAWEASKTIEKAAQALRVASEQR